VLAVKESRLGDIGRWMREGQHTNSGSRVSWVRSNWDRHGRLASWVLDWALVGLGGVDWDLWGVGWLGWALGGLGWVLWCLGGLGGVDGNLWGVGWLGWSLGGLGLLNGADGGLGDDGRGLVANFMRMLVS